MIISSSLKNGTSVDRRLCTSTYRDYSKTPYRNYGKTPCLLHVDIDHRETTIVLSEDTIKRAKKAMAYETDSELKKQLEEGVKEFIEEPTEGFG